MQDPKVLPIRCRRITRQQRIVSLAEAARWEHLLPKSIVRKRPRLTHQPVDDVAILDVALVSSTQPRHVLHQLLGVPHLQVLDVETNLHLVADEPAWHRVTVPFDMDHAARIDTRREPAARFQPTRRQRTQHAYLFRQPFPTTRVELIEQGTQELGVGHAVSKVPTATEHQGLVQCPFEAVMPLLHVAVLVAVASLSLLAH